MTQKVAEKNKINGTMQKKEKKKIFNHGEQRKNVNLIDFPEWKNTQTVKELLIQVIRTSTKIKIDETHQLLDPGNPRNTKQDSKKYNKPTEFYISQETYRRQRKK